MKRERKKPLTIEPEIYVVVRNHENLGETTVFGGEVVESNLIEVGQLVARYKSDKELPNWIDLMLRERRKAVKR